MTEAFRGSRRGCRTSSHIPIVSNCGDVVSTEIATASWCAMSAGVPRRCPHARSGVTTATSDRPDPHRMAQDCLAGVAARLLPALRTGQRRQAVTSALAPALCTSGLLARAIPYDTGYQVTTHVRFARRYWAMPAGLDEGGLSANGSAMPAGAFCLPDAYPGARLAHGWLASTVADTTLRALRSWGSRCRRRVHVLCAAGGRAADPGRALVLPERGGAAARVMTWRVGRQAGGGAYAWAT